MALNRQDQFELTVTVNSVNLGVWDKMTGGNADSSETKYRPGGMVAQVAMGGSTMVENITVSRAFDSARDGAILPDLLAGRGSHAVTASLQPLDRNKRAYGNPIVRQGVLKSVQSPEHDSEGTAASMIALEISTDGDVVA